MHDRQFKFSRAVVVEDQPDTREWLAAAAREAFGGVTSLTFGGLAEAQGWLRGQSETERATPTVALIDLVLPDGSGVDLIRELAELQPAATPVVISIYDDDTHLFEAIAAGAQGYLLKDERPEQLIANLRQIEQGEPPLSPSIARRMLAHFQKALPRHAASGPSDVLLTLREKEVLTLLGRGLRLSDVAAQLGLTRHTVAGYVKVIYSKLNISSRAEAAVEAMKRGLI